MSKSLIAIAVSIFMTGLIAGLFFGVGLKTGVSADQEGIALMIMSTFCQATQGINGQSGFNCFGFVALATIVLAIAGYVEIMATAEKIGDWKIGLAIYGFGWLVGLIMIMSG
ncbi:MAG: hypothetical protein HZB66_01030 [Candidatus Aenigmarchaeota archaeon]|nr:hypothetical protein [Candidatus Aenigmarchaeota archaeon]